MPGRAPPGSKRPAGHTQYVNLASNGGWVLYTDGRTHGDDSDGTFVVQRDALEAFYVQGLIQDHWVATIGCCLATAGRRATTPPSAAASSCPLIVAILQPSPGNLTYGVSGQIRTQYQALHDPTGTAGAVLGFPTEDTPWVSYEDAPADAYPLTQTRRIGVPKPLFPHAPPPLRPSPLLGDRGPRAPEKALLGAKRRAVPGRYLV